ncbi:MAG TPA: transposase [Polyangiaceae bacterium]
MGRILRRRGLERGPAFVDVLLAFYTKRMAKEGNAAGQSGAVVVVQRTSSDLKLNPHLHVVFLDGVYRAQREHVLFHELPHLRSRDVAEVLTRATVRMAKYLRRRGARWSFVSPRSASEDRGSARARQAAVRRARRPLP